MKDESYLDPEVDAGPMPSDLVVLTVEPDKSSGM